MCVFIYSSICILLPMLEGTKKDTVSPKDMLECRGEKRASFFSPLCNDRKIE